MRDPSGRLLRLLSLLQSPREWTGVELAERLGVTPRTIRRDVDRLRELGYPVDATHGNIGGYRLTAGTAMPPLLLDDDEALAIAIGLRTGATAAVTGIEDASLRALAKLEQVLPSRLRHRLTALSEATVVPPAGAGPSADPEILAVLGATCLVHEKVRFTYAKPGSEQSKRFVEPHRLVAAGRRWYLIAYDSDRGDWRTFRLDRITEVHRTGLRVPARELPDGVDAATWLTRSLIAHSGSIRARVVLHQSVEEAAAHVPARNGILEPLDADTCVLTTYPDTPEYLARAITLLPIDYTVQGPPEVITALRTITDRATKGIGPQRL
ncbi:YafY family transcriptional regulator [Nocardia uniformis]|uniref:YafY family transcriptional regulator n=1 Tax=Nocardia uniformis TaxID=53432 RepID=A0A849BUU4_9NOCA|nr:YafY family protein [Nocardia uniformis]NNH68656.1 YafY family transcriptional regulator [Nocardia uniformis]